MLLPERDHLSRKGGIFIKYPPNQFISVGNSEQTVIDDNEVAAVFENVCFRGWHRICWAAIWLKRLKSLVLKDQIPSAVDTNARIAPCFRFHREILCPLAFGMLS